MPYADYIGPSQIQNTPIQLGASAAAPYQVNPAPQGGNGPYGLVPGPVSLPNPFQDLSNVYPNLSNTNSTLSSDIASKLSGTLSPATENALQDAAATFGQGAGVPGSGLQWNNLYGNIAGASEAQQQQGIGDYNSTIPTISGTQTVSPGLQTEIAQQNAVWGAAPNPSQASQQSQSLFNQWLQSQKGPGGGTGGTSATGNPAGATGAVVPSAPTTANPYQPTADPEWTGTLNPVTGTNAGGGNYGYNFGPSDIWGAGAIPGSYSYSSSQAPGANWAQNTANLGNDLNQIYQESDY